MWWRGLRCPRANRPRQLGGSAGTFMAGSIVYDNMLSRSAGQEERQRRRRGLRIVSTFSMRFLRSRRFGR